MPDSTQEEQGEVNTLDLKTVSTKDLAEELRKREGVNALIAEPYEDVTVDVNGPAVVLVIID